MQRINWFPDPNTTGTAPIGVANTKVDYPIVNGRKWLRATSTGTGDVHAEYALSGSQLPPAGSYHVHANAYAQKAGALFIVFVRVNGSYQQPLNVPVGDGQTVTVDRTITIPAGCSQLIVRIGPNNQTVGAIGMMSDILIERADTYDPAVGGGASGLLHGRHHAARIGASVGRVMPDDGHEPMHEPILDHRPESRQVGGYHDHPEQARDEILGHGLCERHRRHYLDERVWRHQCEPTCRLRVERQRCRSDVNELFRQVRQSDRHRDEYAHLHVGRVSGEQDPARRHRIFHRGHDAARLPPLGVMA